MTRILKCSQKEISKKSDSIFPWIFFCACGYCIYCGYCIMDIFPCLWLLYSPMKKIVLHRYLIGCILAFLKNTYSPLICWTIVLINFQRVVWNGQQDGKCFQEPWNQKRRCCMYLHASQSISCCCHVGLCKNWCTSQVKTY